MMRAAALLMKAALIVFFALAALCLGAKPAPGSVQLAMFEKIVAGARREPALCTAAFDVLRRVAEGRAEEIAPDAEAQFGLRPGQLRGANFKFTTVRAHAFRMLGKLGTPAAAAFLEGVRPEDFTEKEVHQLWPEAQIALRDVLLERIPDRQGKAEFLERTLAEPKDAIADAAVDSWAVEELCNGGILPSLPVVQQWIEESFSTPNVRAEKVRFCEQRMRVMMSNPDAVVAIGSALKLSNSPVDPRLTQWAVNQLQAMKSPQANEILSRFAAEISSLPEESMQKRDLRAFALQIREILRSSDEPLTTPNR